MQHSRRFCRPMRLRPMVQYVNLHEDRLLQVIWWMAGWPGGSWQRKILGIFDVFFWKKSDPNFCFNHESCLSQLEYFSLRAVVVDEPLIYQEYFCFNG